MGHVLTRLAFDAGSFGGETALSIVVASLLIGAMIGFLFGIKLGRRTGSEAAFDRIAAEVMAYCTSFAELRRYEPQSEIAIAPPFEYPPERDAQPVLAAAGMEVD